MKPAMTKAFEIEESGFSPHELLQIMIIGDFLMTLT